MDESTLNSDIASPYFRCCIVLTTKHQKSVALHSPFENILKAGVLEYVVDTDQMGTFSGEVDRKGTALDCVRRKCEWGLNNTKAEYALATEGSFGPHPLIPFIASGREILYFIDNKRQFHLYLTDVSTQTNYQMTDVSSYDELLEFAKKALFPSHALIIRPYPRELKSLIFKGLQTNAELESAFLEARNASLERKVWVETDMRAHLNPTRMKAIERLGEKMAQRLLSMCPSCNMPGWGKVDIEVGLPCSQCGTATDQIKAEIYGCTKCSYKQTLAAPHGLEKADPGRCPDCNP